MAISVDLIAKELSEAGFVQIQHKNGGIHHKRGHCHQAC